jgi:RNA polymerase sigma factor (sigma-70 family)
MSAAESVLRHIRHQVAASTTDAALLRAYIERQSEDAFRALIQRHGPMVLRVCRRRLDDAHTAEDAFQATFLSLARSAKSIRQSESLAGWLFRTAQRVAQKSRAAASRRRNSEGRAAVRSAADANSELTARELLDVLDTELARLQERDRLPLLLVYWQGRSYAQAARELRLTLSALHGRLERGRKKLAERLQARGFTPGDLGAILAATIGTTAVPGELLARTAALGTAGAVVPAGVLALTATAGTTKLLPALAAVLLVSAGAIGLAGGFPTTQKPADKATEPPSVPTVVKAEPRVDALGDPLPAGAVARLGSERFRPGKEIEALAYSPDGSKMACWAGSHFAQAALTIWDVPTGKLLRSVDAHKIQLKLLSWLPDGHGCALLRTGRDRYYVWDFTDESAPVPQVPDGVYLNSMTSGNLLAVAISSNGRFLATGKLDTQNQVHPIDLYEIKLNRPLDELSSRSVGTVAGHCVGLLFTPDGRALISLGRTQEPDQPGAGIPRPIISGKLSSTATVAVWDLERGQERLHWEADAPGAFSPVFGVSRQTTRPFALTPDGKALVIGQQDGTVKQWDWQTGRELRSWSARRLDSPANPAGGAISAIALNGEGKYVLTGGMNSSYSVRNLATGALVGQSNGQNQFHATAVSPDGKRVATGGNDCQITILDFATGEIVTPIPGHRSWVLRAFVSPDSRTAVTAGLDGRICKWDLVTGRALSHAKIDTPEMFWALAFTADGRGLIGVGPNLNSQRSFCEVDSGRCRPLGDEFTKTGFAILSAPVGNTVLDLSAEEKTVAIRDWPSGRVRHVLEPPSFEPPANGYLTIAVALSPDGKLAAMLGRDTLTVGDGTQWGIGRVSLFNAVTGRVTHRWNNPDANFPHAVFTPDSAGLVIAGQTIYAANVGGNLPQISTLRAEQALQLLDVESGQSIRTFLPPSADPKAYRLLTALAVSPNGQQIAAAEQGYSIWLYELATGQVRHQFVGHRNEVSSLVFTPDGRRLISTSRDVTSLVWDLRFSALERRSNAAFEQLWMELAKPEWKLAGPAMASLEAKGDSATTFLKSRLHPATPPTSDAKSIDELVSLLDSNRFADRERAEAELRRIGLTDPKQLRSRQDLAKSPEAKARLGKLINDIVTLPVPSERLREIRALELLEHTATPAARDLLADLAKGAPGARLTVEAKASMERLKAK